MDDVVDDCGRLSDDSPSSVGRGSAAAARQCSGSEEVVDEALEARWAVNGG